MEGERAPLEDEFLRLARARRGVDRPRVCFLPTASGDSPDYVGRFHQAYDDVAETSHLTLFTREVEDIEPFLREQDAIYVGGGNTPADPPPDEPCWRGNRLGALRPRATH